MEGGFYRQSAITSCQPRCAFYLKTHRATQGTRWGYSGVVVVGGGGGSPRGCGLSYGDKLSLPGDVLHSPSDVPSGQGEEGVSPECDSSHTPGRGGGAMLMSCT